MCLTNSRSLFDLFIVFQVSEKLPTKPRPAELGWWFRIGRRKYGRKCMPKITSIDEFKHQWIQWWTAAQPKWRNTEHWPFPQDKVEDHWGGLSSGGKDGLFLVVMSLGWWVHAQDSAMDITLDAAICDVSWVLKHLVTSLSASAVTSSSIRDVPVTFNSPTDTPVASARLRRKCTDSEDNGRPKKHARK
jgi:hypothetical protein